MKEVCQGTSNGFTVVDDLPENRIAALRNRYSGCKYVDGNLEITGLDHEDFYNKDLSFLNSIQEVESPIDVLEIVGRWWLITFSLSYRVLEEILKYFFDVILIQSCMQPKGL